MNFFKKFLFIFLVLVIFFGMQTTVNAANIFGFSDPAGCESKDPFLPNLIICGRNPTSAGSCTAYTKECSLGDLVETGSRIIIWIISIFLLIVPLFIMYYGAMIIIYRNMDLPGPLAAIKKRFWEIFIYFIFMLAAWLIVRTVIDIFQVDDSEGRVPIFLLDEYGQSVKVRTFNTNN